MSKGSTCFPSSPRLLGLVEPAEADRKIAEYVSTLLKDGDTVQVGIRAPAAFLARSGVFDNRLDLGVHSELGCRELGRLVKEGVITGKHKNLHPGKVVMTGLTGCGAEDIAFFAGNPLLELYASDYVINIRTIAAHDNMVAINNAIAVDLTGQINSETALGARVINGPGGQPEFAIGAAFSKGGRSITLLYSTALEGVASRIVPQFEEGAIISVPRNFADYIVTEYGIARLMGKSLRERAEELIAIAHPGFRAELRKAAHRMLYP